MSELKLDSLWVSEPHAAWTNKPANDVLADLAKAARELKRLVPRRITSIHVHERADIEYLIGELGELIGERIGVYAGPDFYGVDSYTGIRMNVFALVPANHGLLMFSDGSHQLVRVRPEAEQAEAPMGMAVSDG